MGKKSGPAAPPPPDPVATAAAQSTANREAAIAQANLNRINQVTPQGNLTYTQIGTNPDGTPQYQATQTYSPEQQALYNQTNQIAQALNGTALNNVNRVNQAQSQTFDYSGMTPLQTSINTQGLPSLQTGPQATNVRTGVGNVGAVQSTFGTGGQVNDLSANAGGDIQRSLDYGNLTDLPGVNDFGAERDRVTQSVYAQAASRLDPQFQQQQSDLGARLAASGISENSDAYRREMDNFARQRTDAYNQANYSAIQAGGAEQSRLFGMALGARQQGQNEANTQGAFANSAQGQAYGQAANTAGFNNQATGQRFSQNQQAAAFGNQAQDQRYTQALGEAELFNNANNMQFQQGQQATATNNTARSQGYNENLAAANFNNAGRQREIEEATYLRNLPLNEIAALLGTGGQLQNPNFVNAPQVGVAAPDYQGAVYANYNAANQQYQAAQQARSSMLGSIFGGLGSIGGAIAMSDARLKERIVPIMRDAKGLMWYTFNYIGDAAKQFGVMAQEVLEVRPQAVIHTPSGYLAVDYRELL